MELASVQPGVEPPESAGVGAPRVLAHETSTRRAVQQRLVRPARGRLPRMFGTLALASNLAAGGVVRDQVEVPAPGWCSAVTPPRGGSRSPTKFRPGRERRRWPLSATRSPRTSSRPAWMTTRRVMGRAKSGPPSGPTPRRPDQRERSCQRFQYVLGLFRMHPACLSALGRRQRRSARPPGVDGELYTVVTTAAGPANPARQPRVRTSAVGAACSPNPRASSPASRAQPAARCPECPGCAPASRESRVVLVFVLVRKWSSLR